jgi:hypothetical protein
MYYEQNKKAIPTTYNGIKMRSILEVRWAIYFDFLGVQWIYEPVKFKIPGHKSYTPDFFLVNEKVFLEIKPESFDWDERHDAFVSLYSYAIAVCRGMPGMAKQSYIKMVDKKLTYGQTQLFGSYHCMCKEVPLEWFYKILWTWVKTHQIIGGGENRKVSMFYMIEMLETYNIFIARGEASEMVWPVSGNQCPKCRKFDIWECDDFRMTPYCSNCGYILPEKK